MISRRGFLGLLAGVVATPVLKPLEKLIPAPPVKATIGQYADYLSFHDLALNTSIDPVMANLAEEMNYRLALTLNSLVNLTANGGTLGFRNF